MSKIDVDSDIVNIDLTKTGKDVQKAASTVRASAVPPTSVLATGMSMDQLHGNYEAIVRARAIFYPVAFQLLRELGRGRQGVVFLGLRHGARGCITEHAIKLLNPGLYRSPEEYWTDMGRIASQISRLHNLQSPNLVSGHSYEETNGIGYVQMEAIDGMDLRCFLGESHLELAKSNCTPREWAQFMETLFFLDGDKLCLQPGAVVYILRRILRGIERLHSMNFLHCDVKPANIMIDRLGYVKVVDFGRAVMVGEKLTFLLGSPMYMAPETHRRNPSGLQSDFYSVGLVGLEMLRGEPLTADDVDEEELLRIKMALPECLAGLLPEHVKKKRKLTRIIRRLLEPDSKNRFGSAEEAEVGEDGLIAVDQQFTREGEDIEYRREFSDYLSKLVDIKTRRVEIEHEHKDSRSSRRPKRREE